MALALLLFGSICNSLEDSGGVLSAMTDAFTPEITGKIIVVVGRITTGRGLGCGFGSLTTGFGVTGFAITAVGGLTAAGITLLMGLVTFRGSTPEAPGVVAEYGRLLV